MTHDKYDNDILKALRDIAKSLERIEKKLPIKEPEVKIDPSKSLYEQNMPCCHNCDQLAYTVSGQPICRSMHEELVRDCIDYCICSEYSGIVLATRNIIEGGNDVIQ